MQKLRRRVWLFVDDDELPSPPSGDKKFIISTCTESMQFYVFPPLIFNTAFIIYLFRVSLLSPIYSEAVIITVVSINLLVNLATFNGQSIEKKKKTSRLKDNELTLSQFVTIMSMTVNNDSPDKRY